MIEPPVILTTDPLLYAGVRQLIPVSEIQKVMVPTLEEIRSAIASQDGEPAGPWFTHHFHKPLETFDFEICVPVVVPVQPAGRVQAFVWPAMKVARTVYHGSYSGLPSSWGEFEQWVKANNSKPGTEFWERYVVDPSQDSAPENWRTELSWPLLD